jgi:hypothetical protein
MVILLISTFWVARVTGLGHCTCIPLSFMVSWLFCLRNLPLVYYMPDTVPNALQVLTNSPKDCHYYLHFIAALGPSKFGNCPKSTAVSAGNWTEAGLLCMCVTQHGTQCLSVSSSLAVAVRDKTQCYHIFFWYTLLEQKKKNKRQDKDK